jgi:ribosomal protein L11 methyltransferase
MTEPGRRWLEVRARGPAGDERNDLLADGLVAIGGRAIEERDGWFVTHVEEPVDLTAFLAAARAGIAEVSGLDVVELETSWKAHEEWAETWRKGLAPRRITERIVVRPSWTEVADVRKEDLVIVLDPGMAFGTAEHGTTRGCLRLLDQAVTGGEHVLDVGSGSGILAIAAVLLGAADVLAVESDPLAWDAIAENTEANGVAGRVRLEGRAADADWLRRQAPVHGIVANIETGVLVPLLPGFRDALAPGGWLILSGIPADEWPHMREVTEAASFRFVAADADGEWRSGLFRRRADADEPTPHAARRATA